MNEIQILEVSQRYRVGAWIFGQRGVSPAGDTPQHAVRLEAA